MELVFAGHHELALHVEGVKQALHRVDPLSPAHPVDKAKADLQLLDLVHIQELELAILITHQEHQAVQQCIQPEGGVVGQRYHAAEPGTGVVEDTPHTVVLQQRLSRVHIHAASVKSKLEVHGAGVEERRQRR